MAHSGKLYILNAPILTNWGTYQFGPLSVEAASAMLHYGNQDFISAVGHEATAQVLSKLLEVTVPVNRVAVKMEHGDKAIVFRLLQRLSEGKVLSEEEMESVPYELGLLSSVCRDCAEV